MAELGREIDQEDGGKGIAVVVHWICGARLKWLLVVEIEDWAQDKGLKFCRIEVIDIIEVLRVDKLRELQFFIKRNVLEDLGGWGL